MKKVSLAALSALVVSTPLMAQETYNLFDDRAYIAPFGSYIIPDKDRKAENGWGGGFAIGKPINEYMNLEVRGTYEYLDNESDGPGAYKIWSTDANALFFFRREGFQPYLVAGVGGIRDNVKNYYDPTNPYSDQHHKWSLTANGGLGFLVPLSDNVLLRADGRYRWDANRGDILDEESFGDWTISAGLQIPLGEKPRAAAVPVPAAPATRTIELSADALFAFDKAVLSPQGMRAIDEFLQELQGASFSSILVAGHTDPFGTDLYNLQLSQRRADAVMDYMVRRGVPADRIRAEGLGESQLKVTPEECAARGATTKPSLIECYQPNRRVEVTVTGAAPAS